MDTICFFFTVERDREAGTQENKGWERTGSRTTRGGKRGIYMRVGGESRNKEGNSLLFITEYHSVKNTYLAKFYNSHLTSTNA